MRQIIAALQVSLDGFIEGPNVELDWVDSWEDTFDIIGNVDTFILGARMYPGPLLRQADVAPPRRPDRAPQVRCPSMG